MTPNTEQPIRVMRRKVRRRQVNDNSIYKPGQRIGDGSNVHGGGGPENTGAARTDLQAGIQYYQSQPSWGWEADVRQDYFGYARPSLTPNLAGIPSNNFRGLGDNHGGRQ
jgi:hypothetical protein